MAHNIDPKGLLPKVHPAMASKARAMGAVLERQGILVGVYAGLRTFDEQAALYAKGRDVNGTVVDPTSVVTNAAPGQTAHNYGLAIDVVPFKTNSKGQLEYTWTPAAGVWDAIGRAGEAQGLTWGGRWTSLKDYPHFEIPGFNWRQLSANYQKGGISAVWASLPPEWAAAVGGGGAALVLAAIVGGYFLLR